MAANAKSSCATRAWSSRCRGESSDARVTRSKAQGNFGPDRGRRSPDRGRRSPDRGRRSPDDGWRSPDDGWRSPDDGWRSPDALRVSSRNASFTAAFQAAGGSSSPLHPSSQSPSDTSSLPRQARQAMAGEGRVLIVEDDLTTANALRSILTRKGCEILVAASLAEALPILDRSLTHVLLDLMLPDGDGTEILRRLREKHSDVRVIVTTAANDAALMQKVQSLRPHRILRKPIDLVDLLSAIGIM